MEELDETDLLLLKILGNNSNYTVKELAVQVNLSTSPVFERLKRQQNQQNLFMRLRIKNRLKKNFKNKKIRASQQQSPMIC